MDLTASNEVGRSAAAAMSVGFGVKYADELAKFDQQLPLWKMECQAAYDRNPANPQYPAAPVVPRRQSAVWDERTQSFTYTWGMNERDFPVFLPVKGVGGSAIAAGNPTANTAVADETLKTVRAIAAFFGVKV